MVELIYCAAGGKRFAQIAVEAGFRYGAQLPGTTHWPLYFADQNWKRPNRGRYMAELARLRPVMATVTDLERPDQLATVLNEAEEAAQYVERVLIIPKYPGAVDGIPRRIGSADVVLAYSVPTRYGATPVPAWEFSGWPVHLLGGNPQNQLRLARYLDVVSADGNAATGAARRGVYWSARTGCWVTRDPALPLGPDLPYRAFARSCAEIMQAWGKQARRALAGEG